MKSIINFLKTYRTHRINRLFKILKELKALYCLLNYCINSLHESMTTISTISLPPYKISVYFYQD